MILSIIIPVYNVERYIRKTLESVISQARCFSDEIEVIVVNDGSSDGSMEIVSDFSNQFANFIVINQTNHGLSVARNVGLRHSHGNYVWFVDSDDYIGDDFLSKVVQLLSHVEIDVYSFKIREYDEASNKLIKERYSLSENNLVYCLGYEMIDFQFRKSIKISPIQQFIINRNFLIRNNLLFTPNIYHEDLDFAPRMLLYADKAAYVPWVSYCYLKRISGSITSNKLLYQKRMMSLLKIYDYHTSIRETIRDNNKRRAFDRHICHIAASAWYYYAIQSKSNDCDSVLDISNYVKRFKKELLSSILYDYNIMRILRWLAFIISPSMFKKFKKSFV